MLSDQPVYATLPTADLARLRQFYEDVLEFKPSRDTPAGIYYGAARGTFFAITRSGGEPSGSHTQMGFAVTGLEEDVARLRQRGVKFEEYETPKTVDGIADMGVGRAAWFQDPDGNLIGMIQFNDPLERLGSAAAAISRGGATPPPG
jgi:predicted enzyme related to lactoylglutathione lyase